MNFPRMKEIRENAGLKQKDIAEAMNVSKGSYSMQECGTDTIPLKRLNQFCNYFDVSIDYVVGFNDKKKYANQKPDIKQPTWNRQENAKNLILTTTLYELAKKYHYSIDKILGKDKDSEE